METKPVLITWGRCRNGTIYIDSYAEIDENSSEQAEMIKYIELRSHIQNTEMALFHVPVECTREMLENYLQVMEPEKLTMAKVREQDILVRFGPNTSKEYLKKHKKHIPLIMGLDPELDVKIGEVLKEI